MLSETVLNMALKNLMVEFSISATTVVYPWNHIDIHNAYDQLLYDAYPSNVSRRSFRSDCLHCRYYDVAWRSDQWNRVPDFRTSI